MMLLYTCISQMLLEAGVAKSSSLCNMLNFPAYILKTRSPSLASLHLDMARFALLPFCTSAKSAPDGSIYTNLLHTHCSLVAFFPVVHLFNVRQVCTGCLSYV